MNLVELMEKHPGKKYRHSVRFGKGEYVQRIGTSWVSQCSCRCNTLVGECFMENGWELYQEPINITEADVGKKVKLRDDSTETILAIHPNKEGANVVRTDGLHTSFNYPNGSYWSDGTSVCDIIEILT